jgi:hypothetical protein
LRGGGGRYREGDGEFGVSSIPCPSYHQITVVEEEEEEGEVGGGVKGQTVKSWARATEGIKTC